MPEPYNARTSPGQIGNAQVAPGFTRRNQSVPSAQLAVMNNPVAQPMIDPAT